MGISRVDIELIVQYILNNNNMNIVSKEGECYRKLIRGLDCYKQRRFHLSHILPTLTTPIQNSLAPDSQSDSRITRDLIHTITHLLDSQTTTCQSAE